MSPAPFVILFLLLSRNIRRRPNRASLALRAARAAAGLIIIVSILHEIAKVLLG